MDIILNNVLQKVCCSLDHSQLVFLYAIGANLGIFPPLFSTEGPSCWKVSALCCRHVRSGCVEGWRVVMKQSQLQLLV